MAAAVVAATLAGAAGAGAAAPDVALLPGQDRLLLNTGAQTATIAGGTCAADEAALVPVRAPEQAGQGAGDGTGAHWLRVRLLNPGGEETRLVLTLPYPPLDVITLHLRSEDGQVETQHHGFAQPLDRTGLPAQAQAFAVALVPGEKVLAELCIRSAGFVATPVWLMREAAFWRWIQTETLVIGLLLGILGATFVVAAAIATKLRRSEFVAFMAFAAASVGYILVTSGFMKAWVSPEMAIDAKTALTLAGTPVFVTSAWLLRPLLNTAEACPKADLMLRGVIGVTLLAMASPWMVEQAAAAVQALAWGLAPMVMLAAVLRLWWAGARHAWPILFGWSVGLVAALYLYLRSIGAAPSHPIEPLLGPIVCTVAALCFGYALAERLYETERSSLTDPLTGLWNRGWLVAQARSVLARCRRRGAPLSVGVFDADFFKHINDRWGHGVGDVVLKHLAAQAITSLRPSDQIARIGGEEFCVLFPGIPAEEAASALERLRAAIEAGAIGPLPAGAVTISGGVAMNRGGSVPFEVLLHAADMALYRAKETGRNRVEIAPEVRPPARARSRRQSDRMQADRAKPRRTPEPILAGSD